MENIALVVGIIILVLILAIGGVVLYLYYSPASDGQLPETPEFNVNSQDPMDNLLVNVNNNILDFH